MDGRHDGSLRNRFGPAARAARRVLEPAGRALTHPAVWLSLVFILTGLWGLAWGTWRNLCADCPSIAQIATFEPQQTSKLLDHDGRPLTELGIERRTPVSLQSLPEYVPQSFVAVEDRRFYSHGGVDLRGIARAAWGLVRNRWAGGGSTITQQLARNMFVENIGFERRLIRKLKELQVALQLERTYSKDQILEAYINQIYYGHGANGIQTAARVFFGKDALDLNVAEAALLAAVMNRPGTYSPFLNPENAHRRRDLVLDRMAREGFITRDEAARWKLEPIPEGEAPPAPATAPYFEEWVRQILDDRFGSQLYTAGLRIYTTLDVDMQRAAQSAMEQGWRAIEARPGFAHPKYADFAEREEPLQTSGTPYLQGAFIALDPVTGEVKAMIGGRDFRQSKFNRATQALRQAGSSFKPFVYASAVASGIPASHVLVDAPVVLEQLDGTEWKPQNYTDDFSGPLTIREGLRRSINMIAIQLGMEVGLETVAQTARRLGIRTEVERFPSTAIGAAEVIPLQMAEAYSTFATLGMRARPNPIIRVETAEGEVLWEPRSERTRALEPQEARILVSMLEDVANSGTGAGARSIVGWDLPVAGKTGTTNDATDVWFIGFTPNLLAAVWFGMDQPQTIWPKATGGGDAAPVWGRFMKEVYYGVEATDEREGRDPVMAFPDPWPMPEGLTTRRVDAKTGLLASEWCPGEDAYTELFIPGTEPTEICDRFGAGTFLMPRVPMPPR